MDPGKQVVKETYNAQNGSNIEQEERFVIKNLDTGMQMRIDDFDRLTGEGAHPEELEVETPSKKGQLLKGTAKIKSWTQKATAKAKQAVSGIQAKANELSHELKERHTAILISPRQHLPRLGSVDGAAVRRSLDTTNALFSAPVNVCTNPLAPREHGHTSQPDASRRTSSVSSADGPDAGYMDLPAAMLRQPYAASTEAPAAAAAASTAAPAAALALVPHGAKTTAAGNGMAAAVPAPLPGPAVARIHAHKRSGNSLAEARLVQQLPGHEGVVWAIEFSPDGRYLASGGQDCTLRVWEVAAVPRESTSGRASCSGSASDELPSSTRHAAAQRPAAPAEHNPASTSAPTDQQQQQRQRWQGPPGSHIAPTPLWQYTGHTEDILDVSWSPGSRFLLSCSLDKSCRLWHVSQGDCLRTFWHSDFVTAVKFHPSDVQKFVTGSIDGKIRLWSITQTRVLALANLHQDMVTAMAFSSDGMRLLAGTMRGKCRFYNYHDTSGDGSLEYVTQVDVRNSRGQHSSGKKITGIAPVPGKPSQFVVTSNDSRLRLYDGYSLAVKFKGHRNTSTQIRGAVSPAGETVACGSDNGWVYLWATEPGAQLAAWRPGKNPAFEAFLASGGGAAAGDKGDGGAAVTGVAFAPSVVMAVASRRSSDAGDGAEAASRGLELAVVNAKAGADAVAAAAAAAGAAALKPKPSLRHVLVTAGFSGDIKVWELWGTPLPA